MPLAPHKEDDCPFCKIAANCPPASHAVVEADGSSLDSLPQAYTLLSTRHVIAFLDHAPISRGHVLIATRQHRVKLSDASVEEGQAVGAWLGLLSRAVIKAVGAQESVHASEHELGDWNVVQNNGARAAQVVPHVHFHIIPRTADVPDVKARSWTIFGRGQREELDDEDAILLRPKIQEALRQELQDLAAREGADTVALLLGSVNRQTRL